MAAIMAGRIESLRTINGVKFGITKIVKGYFIKIYFLRCYAIFVSPDITHERRGVTLGTPCMITLSVKTESKGQPHK